MQVLPREFRETCLLLAALLVAALTTAIDGNAILAAEPARIELRSDEAQGQLQILIDGREALVYQYGPQLDLPHYYPVRSPSGKLLTIQQTDPYPHHRSVWFADTVELAGKRKASFYNALYSRKDAKDPQSPFRDHVRHVKFLPQSIEGNVAKLGMKLVWEMDSNVPVLDEQRQMRIVAWEGGEYFIDLAFTLTASYGDVTFVSDAAHYAWPYVRIHPQFSGDQGGKLINSEGGIGQKGTHNQPARWIDYSNTIEGQAEGLTIFSHGDNPHPHRWLTREYGTFGPRRADDRNGKPFAVKKGETLQQRVGILVHKGDVQSGRVAERYQQYLDGKL
ncbi:MAG TPA: PmoA family protein [Candidatus Anammoximicrobium sp.]|nr:PmoA family protein [Candidatus Anammoximicrobium sp.]